MSGLFNTFEDQVLGGTDDRPHRTRQLLNKIFLYEEAKNVSNLRPQIPLLYPTNSP